MNYKNKIVLLVVIILSFGCYTTKKVTIKGVALDAKAGAVVVTSNESVFYLDKIRAWEDEYNPYANKNIRVKGRLVTIIDTFSNDKNNIVTIRQSIGVQLLIKNPKIYIDSINKWKKL